MSYFLLFLTFHPSTLLPFFGCGRRPLCGLNFIGCPFFNHGNHRFPFDGLRKRDRQKNINEVDKMLERAKAVTATCEGRITHVEYARFADDLVILVDGEMKWEWLVKRVCKRLLKEFSRVKVEVNCEKTRIVDLKQRAKLRGWVNYFRVGNSSHCLIM